MLSERNERNRPSFSLCHLRFTLAPREPILLPRMNKGITLRGAFGSSFRALVCTDRTRPCDECPLHPACPYGFVFSPRVPEETGRLRLNRDIPRPFVIKPPLDNLEVYEPGQMLSFGLVLMGRVRDFLPYFLVTFRELGERGIGVGRGRFHIAKVEALDSSGRSPTVFELGNPTVKVPDLVVRFSDFPRASDEASIDSLRLRFLTPVLLILKQEEKWVRPTFDSPMRRLRDRIQSLGYFYCGEVMDMGFRAFGESADAIKTVQDDLRWVEEDRFSKHRDLKHTLKGYIKGYIGVMVFRGNVAPFLRFLHLGEYTHVSKAAVFGQGWYQLEGLEKGLPEASSGM